MRCLVESLSGLSTRRDGRERRIVNSPSGRLSGQQVKEQEQMSGIHHLSLSLLCDDG